MRKTSITLAAFCVLQNAHDEELKARGLGEAQRRAKRLRAVVVAPRRVVHRVWPFEVRKWLEFYHLKVAVCHGTPKIRARAAAEDADLYCMTHDGFQWFANEGLIDKCGTQVLIIDELSKYKRGTTARHKGARKHLSKFTVRWGLTGSFTPRSLLDTWAQVFMIDMGRALGQWYTHFRNEFFLPTGYGGYTWQAKPGAQATILGRLQNTCISLEAKDYITLPELVVDDIEFDLPPPVRTTYDEMEKELLTFVVDDRITAPNAAVAQMKCRQICSGALYTGLDKATLVHEEKLDILEDLMDELQGAPLMVVYEFRFEAEAVQKRFGTKTRKVPVLGGDTTDKQADKIIDAWNRGEEPLLLVHPQAAGHGLNLQDSGCCHILAITCPWDYENWDQVIRRVWRSGNKAPRLFLHRALARDTVEQEVAKVLLRKERDQRNFVSALKLRTKVLDTGKALA